MPTSNYSGFDVLIDNEDGSYTPAPSITLNIAKAADGSSLGTVASDTDGIVAPGTVSVSAGTRIRFSGDLGDGRVGYCEAVTS